MRVGVNPEKYKISYNEKMWHRIIVVVHVPNLTDEYYKDSLKVLDASLQSLFKTINPTTTKITVLDNNSTVEVQKLLASYTNQNLIDKYVRYTENKGKVYAVINEVRGVFEPFVTITDCDVLYFSGWEKEIFEIFSTFPKAGMVSSFPSYLGSFYFNRSAVFNSFFSGKLRKGKVVAKDQIDLVLKGLNSSTFSEDVFEKTKQYFLKKKKIALLGASHFSATYRTVLFKNETTYPEVKFQNGYEQEFMDILPEKKNFYRLSAVKTFAYHLGNVMDEIAERIEFDTKEIISPDVFTRIRIYKNVKYIPIVYFVKKLIVSLLLKTKIIK
jgi:hypothetical protein